MNTYIIVRRSGWPSQTDLEMAGSRSSRVALQEMSDQVRWLRSYITREPGSRVGTLCVFEATGESAVREHARRAGLPCDEIIPVTGLVIITDDTLATIE